MQTNDRTGDLLARLDERTKGFQRSLDFLAEENRRQTEALLAALKDHLSEDDNRFSTHDTRIKFLENWRFWILGAIALAGFVIWYLVQHGSLK
jgi:hypothetical protein